MLCVCLTCRTCQAFTMLPSLGVTKDVDDERGKFTGVKTGQFLTPLQTKQIHIYSDIHDSKETHFTFTHFNICEMCSFMHIRLYCYIFLCRPNMYLSSEQN